MAYLEIEGTVCLVFQVPKLVMPQVVRNGIILVVTDAGRHWIDMAWHAPGHWDKDKAEPE